MKKIYLHIGYNKTGTSTLQNTFFRQKAVLAKHGLLYPTKCRGKRRSPAHHALSESILYGLGESLPHLATTSMYKEFSVKYFWDLLIEEIEQSDCTNVFISSESFINLRGREEQIEQIRTFLEGYDVKILIYLRRQPEFLEAAYNQSIKHGREKRTINELMETVWPFINYFDELEGWSSVFGHQNIIVRIYNTSLIEGGIVKDVLHLLGLTELENQFQKNGAISRRDKMANPRLPNNMVEFKRRINAKLNLPRSYDEHINRILQWAGRFLPNKPLFSEEKKQEILLKNHVANQKLGEKYLHGKYPFS